MNLEKVWLIRTRKSINILVKEFHLENHVFTVSSTIESYTLKGNIIYLTYQQAGYPIEEARQQLHMNIVS